MLGLKQFYPWFISNQNSASNKGFVEVVIEILARLEESENRDDFVCFLRGDVNIFMPWLRVSKGVCFDNVLSLDGLVNISTIQ